VAEVSIVVPARDAAESIGRQLGALAALRTRHAYEVVVADHGSTDRTRAVVNEFAERLPTLRVVDAAGAHASGGVRNRAADAAEGSFLAFCDADDVVDPGWLDELLAASAGRDVLVRGAVQMFGEFQRPAGPDGVIPRYLGFLPYADTCSLGIRADTYRRIGGFDDTLARSIDVEFSWRAQLYGVALVDAPAAVVNKSFPTDTRTQAEKSYGWGQAQALLYRRYRDAGMPARGTRKLFDDLRTVARAAVPAARRRDPGVVTDAAWAAGRLTGSVRAHVWYP